MTMKRRDALKTISVLGAGAGMAKFLPGCGDDGEPVQATVVYLMMENRSYDHQLGARGLLEGKPGDGLVAGMTNPALDGSMVAIHPATFQTSCVIDPPHGWTAYDTQFNAGANDGFVRAHQEDNGAAEVLGPMQYQTRDQVPVSWALADAYTICDRWFASVRGPTWPNRMYWHSGTSQGINSNMIPTQGFSWDSIYHRLEAGGVDYAYYYSNLAVLGLIDSPTIDVTNRIHYFEDFLDAAAAGRLAPVVYIDPTFFSNDDHPPAHMLLGQALIAAVYTALATSPQWPKCTLVITYDEGGGFFDHVPPPLTADDHAAMGFDRMGFRVPAQIIGPYAKPGYVSSVVYDHTSALKHLEVKFALAPLTMRSTAANDILDAIDLDRLAAGTASEPVAIPPVVLDHDAIDAACMGVSAAKGLQEWFDLSPERFAKYDRRDRSIETIENIFEYLDKHNAGRLVGTKKY